MFRFYTPILFLQFFCLYLAYKRQDDRKWFWIIIIFPLLGSIFYLFDTFYNRRNVENITEEVKTKFISNYKLDKMEKEIAFSNTVAKRIELADEHLRTGNFHRALELYESCLEGIHKNDIELLMKLIQVNYQLKQYDEVIKYGEQIYTDNIFRKSQEKVALAWSYYNKGNSERADQVFAETDVRFSNYDQRLEYAKYLQETGKSNSAKELLGELISEIESMDSYERKLKRKIFKQIKTTHANIKS